MNISVPLLPLCCNRITHSKVRDLSDVVDQAVERPLDVDLGPASQSKPVHSFTRSYVAENRFDDAQAFAIGLTAPRVSILAFIASVMLPGRWPRRR